MRWLGYRQVARKSIRVDAADINRRMKEPHVAELSVSIKASGDDCIHAPTVRAGSMELLCGRDRFAALSLGKTKRPWVHVLECDDAEAREIELAENIYRRADNRAELLAQLSEIKKQQIRAAEAQAGTVSHLSEQAVVAKARKEVARAAGVSTAAVRKAEQRAEAVQVGTVSHLHGASSPDSAPTSESSPVDMLGVPVSEVSASLLELAAAEQAMLNRADRFLRLAQAELADSTRPEIVEVKQDIHRVAARVRQARPAVLCPYCKATGDAVVRDAACAGRGVVARHLSDQAPEELRVGEPRVYIGRKLMSRAEAIARASSRAAGTDLAGGEASAAPRSVKSGKERKLNIELPDGTRYEHPGEGEPDTEVQW